MNKIDINKTEMKNIIKAMNETEFKPREKWWGFVDNNRRYLCRYNHILAIFDLEKKELVGATYETITDKNGVYYAIKYFYYERSPTKLMSLQAEFRIIQMELIKKLSENKDLLKQIKK